MCGAGVRAPSPTPLGMLTFDSFSFIQVTFVMFILLAFASVATEGFRVTRSS